MRRLGQRRLWLAGLLGTLLAWAAAGQYRQRIWAKYEAEMQDPVEDPTDAHEAAEFALGRLRYRSPMDRPFRYSRWGIDVNKGDRTFISLWRRLTRVQARSIETILDASSDEMFAHPWMMAGSVGDWRISPDEARRMREYFLRGGFLLVDDFHNEREWANFMAGVQMILPGAQAEELEDGDAIFHTVYDMKERVRVPGANVVHGSQIERGGVVPHWRGIRDAQGRIVIAICFNMDVGDGWEFADDPHYPERFASEAMRLGVNYVLYAMTH
ncbi:MAG: DUF4159 domain-containing protein [Acidobacteria bacterium]|nr:DUF4159 domain-containing protein [Acidobacteriota bacterium]